MEKETKINYVQHILYTTEYYQQIREYSLLVIGCKV